MIKRFFRDLLYGYPAFGNLRWEIIEKIRVRCGYYKMKPLSYELVTKYGDLMTRKRKIIQAGNVKKMLRAIENFNEVIREVR